MTLDHPSLPPRVSRPWLVVAGLWWVGAVLIVGSGGDSTLEPLEPGSFRSTGVLSTDVLSGRFGPWALIETSSGPVLANLPKGAEGSQGDHVSVAGIARGAPGIASGEPYRGTVRVDEYEVVAGPASPLAIAGNALRARVLEALRPEEPARALLTGFLIGDTSGIDELDIESMRRAGLSHFTAVSGSNVALFLGILFVTTGPLSLGPKRRAIVGLIGIPVYAAATRFEPSVMRASVMAAIVLAGRLFDLALEAWQLLAAAVIVLLTLDPGLATHLGFQLSVAATGGVLVGARWPIGPGGAKRALAVSLGAQAAVAPLLIGSFGEIPLLSPAVNLIAAPFVVAATVLGVVGVMGIDPILDLAVWIAGLVLGLARAATRWPQIGWPGIALAMALALVSALLRKFRGPIAIAAAVAVVALLLGGGSRAPESGVVAFDIGQGDALLLSGGDGRFALVDGGPDPVLLMENLIDYRVRRLELVVLTHTHADHAAGLAALLGRIPIEQFWAVIEHHETGASEDLLDRLSDLGVALSVPVPGDRYDLGSLDLTVLGPLRRYASPNDESIVMLVEGSARTMLLTGDVETIAQSDLGTLQSDVLKVPHHGAATSDLGWLKQVGAELAVISVGDNDFGHPDPSVIATLESSGADVARTDLEGDVIVDLG